jgi:hypothetical protein
MIAIKGMKEIPSCCRHCPCSDDSQCNLTTQYNDLKGRLDNCPLIEIITCKDCDNRCTGGLCTKHNITVTKDFYCRDGERRE